KKTRTKTKDTSNLTFEAESGTRALLEERHDLPLVDITLALRTGSIHDPVGHEGLAYLTGRRIRMGTSRMDGTLVEETIARLGARLTADTALSSFRLHGTVIRRNFEPFLALISALVQRPAFRSGDLQQVRKETLSDLVSALDNDRGVAA